MLFQIGWTPKNQGKWVSEHLGPLLKNSELRDVKLFVGDDQRYTLPWWPEKMVSGAGNVMDYVYGFAVHWYWDRIIPPTVLDQTQALFPDKILLNTESALGDKPWEQHRPILGSWDRAEKHATGIIQDFQHNVAGWIDWSLVLDETGGPSYVNNTIDAPVIFNTTSKTEYYKQPTFYVFAHFSTFIPPGSIRIDANLIGFRSRKVKVVAFLRPDDAVTIVFCNQYDKEKFIEFTDEERGSYQIKLEPRSITTFLYA